MAHFEALKGPKGLPLRYLENSGIISDACVVLSVSQVPNYQHENIKSLRKGELPIIKYKRNKSPTFASVLILWKKHLISFLKSHFNNNLPFCSVSLSLNITQGKIPRNYSPTFFKMFATIVPATAGKICKLSTSREGLLHGSKYIRLLMFIGS